MTALPGREAAPLEPVAARNVPVDHTMRGRRAYQLLAATVVVGFTLGTAGLIGGIALLARRRDSEPDPPPVRPVARRLPPR